VCPRRRSGPPSWPPSWPAPGPRCMSLAKIERIIDAIRHERYRFKPVKRVHIPKKNSGKTRPLGLTSRSSPTSPTGFGPAEGATPHCARSWTSGKEHTGSSRATSPTVSGRWIIRSCSTRWRRRSTMDGSRGCCATCCKPGIWRTGGGTQRCPARRVASPVQSNIYLHHLDNFAVTGTTGSACTHQDKEQRYSCSRPKASDIYHEVPNRCTPSP